MSSITITVKFFGPLREKMGENREVTIPESGTIRAAVEGLSINPQAWYLYSVNGEHARADAQLKNGDVLTIIPPISGG
ncbi:MAG TPA: MoaD/ThiS family protein [Dissulfurispiraceae bacterium]|nr:MoaD/ThiS family protein [Dissulfurispiraceae bacterium]